jgi:hypothetical protein
LGAAKHASGSVDLIGFDNLGMLIGAEYNNSTKIQAMMDLNFQLTQRYDTAVLIAAHPKKGNKLDAAGNSISLRNDPEKFFEETMGSSRFINSTGSLWGIQRDRKNGRTDTAVCHYETSWTYPVADRTLARSARSEFEASGVVEASTRISMTERDTRT